jgi:hypothetical protein
MISTILGVLSFVSLMGLIFFFSIFWMTADYTEEEKQEAWEAFFKGINEGFKK